MSYTLDMAKFNCVVAGRRLKNISEFQRSDDGEKGTTSDPVYRDWETDRKSTRQNSSHRSLSRMPSSA